jgi:hypothetical protein
MVDGVDVKLEPDQQKFLMKPQLTGNVDAKQNSPGREVDPAMLEQALGAGFMDLMKQSLLIRDGNLKFAHLNGKNFLF